MSGPGARAPARPGLRPRRLSAAWTPAPTASRWYVPTSLLCVDCKQTLLADHFIEGSSEN